MRVAFFIPSLEGKGPVILARDLAETLRHRVSGIEFFYFSDKPGIQFDFPTRKISMSEKIDFDKFDILHSHGIRPDLYLFRNRKQIKGKLISTMHIYMKEDLLYTYNRLISVLVPPVWRFILSRHDKIVALSLDMMKYYAALGIGETRLTYAYNSRRIPADDTAKVDTPDIPLLENARSKYKVVGVSAALTVRKGVHQVIQLLRSRTDLCLVIIGQGPEEPVLRKLASKLQVDDRILWMGYRPDAQRYFPYFDVYAMTSYSEGFPLVLIEAAHHKLRVVCSEIPVFHELFTNKEVAFYKLDDIQSLSSAVDTALRSDMNIKLSELMKTKYSIDAMGERYLKIYNE